MKTFKKYPSTYVKCSSDVDCTEAFERVKNYAKKHWGRLIFNTPELIGFWIDDPDGMGVVRYEDLCKYLHDNPEMQNETGSELYWEIQDVISLDDAVELYKKYGKRAPKWLMYEVYGERY